MTLNVIELFKSEAHSKILLLVIIAVVFDMMFGILRAMKEHKFNSCVGIDGAIRKIGMLVSVVFLMAVDILVNVNLIGFIPDAVRNYLGINSIGIAEFFGLLYLAYEVISVLKNMTLCGLPVKRIWEAIRGFLLRYTDELPDADELESEKIKDE